MSLFWFSLPTWTIINISLNNISLLYFNTMPGNLKWQQMTNSIYIRKEKSNIMKYLTEKTDTEN